MAKEEIKGRNWSVGLTNVSVIHTVQEATRTRKLLSIQQSDKQTMKPGPHESRYLI